MIEGIIALLFVVYCIFRYIKTRKMPVLFLAAVLLSLQLAHWPFFLPYAASSSCLAGSTALFLFYDFYKKRDRQLLFYGLVLLYFAVISAVEIFHCFKR